MLKPQLPLTDPDSPNSELEPGDIAREPTPITQDEERLHKLTMDYFRASSTGRKPFEPMVFESWAFYLGNQHVMWGEAQGTLVSQRKTRSPHKVFQKRNKIRPKVKKALAVALRDDPDVTISPWTGSQQDRASSMIARAVNQHYAIAHHDKQTLWSAARWAWTTSTVREKYWWDPLAWAEVPTGFDDDGNITGSSLAQVGNICSVLTPWTECYPDPEARSEDEIRWIIHAKEESLEAIKAKYKDGWMVKGGTPNGDRGVIETRIASVVGGYAKGSEPQRSGKTQTVYEVWEKPTLAYPEGRWWTATGDGRIVRPEQPLPAWLKRPADGRYDLPFNALSYETPQGTVHALNAVWDMVGSQRDYNNSVSRMAEWTRTMYGKILACEGSQISTTSFDSAKEGEVIYWHPNPGGPPQHLPAPQIPAFIIQGAELSEKDMQDIIGQHEVSQGQVPSQVSAASAIRMLLDSDTTQIADFTQEVEAFVERRADFRLRLARAYFKEPRLLFMAQTTSSKTDKQQAPPPAGAPQQQSPPGLPAGGDGMPSPIMQVQTFESFAQGSFRVIVTPGSATPKSPEANAEMVLELMKAGLFGPPGDPSAAKVVLEELEIMDPNVVYETMLQARADAMALQQATQPDPATAALQQAQMQGQIAQIMEAVKVHGQIAVIQAKAQAEAEAKAMDLHGQMQFEYVRAHIAAMAPPAMSIAAKLSLGSTAGPSAERAMGLEPDAPAEQKAMNAKPAPAATGGNGAKGQTTAAPKQS
jgi:hypothetical protein